MVKVIDGNILDSKVNVIGHQVNCMGAFGSGVARAIRNHDYGLYENYKMACDMANKPEDLLGTIKFCVSSKDKKIYAHMFGQLYYGSKQGVQYTSIEAITRCLNELKSFCKYNNFKVAIPYKIGCVRGGADWNEVYKIIDDIFSDYEIELWRLDNG